MSDGFGFGEKISSAASFPHATSSSRNESGGSPRFSTFAFVNRNRLVCAVGEGCPVDIRVSYPKAETLLLHSKKRERTATRNVLRSYGRTGNMVYRSDRQSRLAFRFGNQG